MDRSLWILLTLKLNAWLRRWSRSVRSLKGLLLAVVGSLVFVPSLIAILFTPKIQSATQLAAARQYGALILFAYCVLNVLLSSGDRAVYYSPAEVNFLFSGPYRPRQLLIYKVVGGLLAALITALFMALAFRQHAAMFPAAYLGLFLGLVLLYLFSLSVGLMIATSGAIAFNWTRKLVFAGLITVAGLALWPLGASVLSLPPAQILERAVNSPTLNLILTPFRPFVMTFTAERIWPDLIGWSGLSLLVDLVLLGFVLMLNAQFVEASAAASERIYEKAKKAKAGSAWVDPGSTRYALPMFPWWGGIGPNFWRQMTTALRSPSRLFGLLILYLFPLAVNAFNERPSTDNAEILGLSLSVWGGILIFAPTVVGYDFRPDLNRMEDLKTLPIRAGGMVVGQILTPVLILTLASWFVLGCLAAAIRSEFQTIATLAVLVVPLNAILMLVENLYFLWFPFRSIGANSFDFQAMGRQMLLLAAKGTSVVVVSALSACPAALVYYFMGKNWPATVGTAWITASFCAIGLVPLVARAFEHFDVAALPPE